MREVIFWGILVTFEVSIPYGWYARSPARTWPILDAAAVPIAFTIARASYNDRWLRSLEDAEHWFQFGVPMWLVAWIAGWACSKAKLHRAVGYLLVLLVVWATLGDLVS